MKQSIYTQISKKIGLQGNAEIPSIAEAQQLCELVKKGDAYAFEKVFKIHRFAPSGTTLEQSTAQNIIFEAFGFGSSIFRDMEVRL